MRLFHLPFEVPKEPMVDIGKSSKPAETVEFYLIPTESLRQISGKTFYKTRNLVPLTAIIGDRLGDREKKLVNFEFETYTDGKDNHYLTKFGPGVSIEMDGKYSFHPTFFKAIGSQNLALVKIQAPSSWHQSRYPNVDPEITLMWRR